MTKWEGECVLYEERMESEEIQVDRKSFMASQDSGSGILSIENDLRDLNMEWNGRKRVVV